MVEPTSLKMLIELYEQLSKKIELINKIVNEKKMLSGDLIGSTIEVLKETEIAQNICIEEISTIIGTQITAETPIDEIRRLLSDYEESKNTAQFIINSRNVINCFLSLYSDDKECNVELSLMQTLIRELTDEQIIKLDFDKDIKPYNDYYNLVIEEDLYKIKAAASTLKDNFKDTLLMGLFLKSIHVGTNDQHRVDTPEINNNEQNGKPLKSVKNKVNIVTAGEPELPLSFNAPLSNEAKCKIFKDFSSSYFSNGTFPFTLQDYTKSEDIKPNQAETASTAADFDPDKVAADKVTADKVAADKAAADKVAADKVAADKVAADKAAADKVAADKAAADKAAADKAAADKAAADKAAADKAAADKAAADKAAADKAASDKAASDKAAADKAKESIVKKENEKPTDFGITADMTAREAAKQIYDQGVSPLEHPAAFQHIICCLLREGKTVCEEDRVENSIAQALVLSKALAANGSPYEKYYRQLTLALDSPLDVHQYDGNTIVTIFDGNDQESSLHLATVLRALFAPDMQYDYSLHAYAKSLFNDFDSHFNRFYVLKPLFNMFLQINESFQNGFSVSVLRNFSDNQTEQAVFDQIKTIAGQLLNEPVIKNRINALIPMKSICFGQGSDLRECMEIICEDRRYDRDFVEMVYNNFCDTNNKSQVISPVKIEEIFEHNWRVASDGMRAPRELISIPRLKIIDGFNERLSVIGRWLKATEDDIEGKNLSKPQMSLRNEIISEIKRILPDISKSCDPADGVILTAILTSIYNKLVGQIADRYINFADFLRTGVFYVDKAGMPVIEKAFLSVKFYEPWRNALYHISEPMTGLKETLVKISDPAYPYLFDNIGQAISICQYLNMINGDTYNIAQYKDDIPRAHLAAVRAVEDYKSELELSFAYGRIAETFKEDILENIENFTGIFMEYNNYGCLRTFLEALRRDVEEGAKIRYAELLEDISGRKEANKRPELDSILQIAMEKLKLPEQNFVVAEEYINRFDAGIIDELKLNESNDESAFLQFISDEYFNRLYDLCRRNQSMSLRGFGQDYVEKELKKQNISKQYQESSKTLIGNLPNRPDEVRPQTIMTILSEIGFTVTRATIISTTSSMVRVSVEVQPNSKDKAEYAHPVDIMGTKLKSPIDVVCLFGKMQANDIVDRVCGLELSRTAIVFLNGALDLPGRRQIAERFHREKSGQNPFLLVDWVLLLYLALFQKTERLPIFLCCSLAYTSSFQPFVTAGSVSDEMFIGRKRELNQILDPKGPVIVYGGRQLGKTALLERALSRANHPEKKEYAILIRSAALCNNEKDLTQAIIRGLHNEGLNTANVFTLHDLCSDLKRKYDAKYWNKLLFLIDEADTILAEFRKTVPAYKPIIPLSDLKRDTGNDFKFVLAGLHNVCRAATDPNTIFGQLGGALTIKPLAPADALELLSRPLRYMGFRVNPLYLEHILINTNFYPGIIHYVGYSLVENLSTRYVDYYQASRGNPPYELNDKQLGDIMSNDALNEKINERIRWTLSVDSRYFMLARCIAYLYCVYPEENKTGYSTAQILEYAELLEISSLKNIGAPECTALLLELVEMGILVPPTADTFRLRQHRFLDAIGNTPEKIEEAIIEAERESNHAG